MAQNQLVLAGSQSQKQRPRKYAPIWVNRYCSGYWPNRNPLRDAALPVLQEKFYGSLNDALIDGINCEINTRSELARRFGNSVYNSNTAGPQQRFYSFPVFANNSTSAYQRVLSSSATQITDITNNGAGLVYFKPAGAQKTTFQAIGDTCFFADTVVPKQLLSFTQSWAANSNSFIYGNEIVDSNGNVQKCLGAAVQITNVAITVTSGVSTLTISYTGTAGLQAGMTVNLIGLTNATFLNNTSITLETFSGGTLTAIVSAPAYASTADTGAVYLINNGIETFYLGSTGISSNVLTINYGLSSPNVNIGNVITFNGITNSTFSFLNGTTMTITNVTVTIVGGHITIHVIGNYTHTDVSTGTPTNGYITWEPASITTGSSQPTWATNYLGITFDDTTAWLYSGPAVRNVGIVAPNTAPVISNTPAAPQGGTWAASTYYFPGPIMYDSTSSSLQQLTTAGTTNGSVPVFSATAGVTTTDGTAVWTSLGLAARNTATTYAVGAFIMATWSKTFPVYNIGPRGQETITYKTITYSAFYQCTVAGTTGSVATGSIAWPLSGTYVDGTVTWTFIGLEVRRTSSATSSPAISTTFTAGNIGNSQAVDIYGNSTSVDPNANYINDNTNFEQITLAGKSGSTVPSWSTTVGGSTVDGGAIWTNVGLSGNAANTGYWFYAYAYLSTTTPDVSSASPIAGPIQRAQESWISISGNNSTDPQVDTIRIYRSLQQVASVTTVTGSELFWIADIPMPTGNSWEYVDTSNDPPDPTSTMNTFIIADTTGVNTPPLSAITNLVYYLGRLWGSVGNTVYASAGPDVLNDGNPYTAFPPANFIDFPGTVIRMMASSQGLLVYTSNGIQIVTGNGVSSTGLGFTTFVPLSYADNICLGGYDGLTVDGSTTYIYTADKNIVSISSSGLQWISIAISNKLKNSFTLPDGNTVTFDPQNSYLSWFVNGDDFGLFLSDGTYGWFRMMPSSAPDAGNMVWSPFAEIVGGVSAVQNIETSIGTWNLLLGPGTSGPILKRDFSVNTDNGSTFSWFATFGSIILAHPGEIAMVQSVVVDSVAVGSHPYITVYFDEINSNGVNYIYNNYKFDPYTATESTTTYADRFYMSDVPESVAICRHLQLSINFPAEDAANTVLSSTIIGATEFDN